MQEPSYINRKYKRINLEFIKRTHKLLMFDARFQLAINHVRPKPLENFNVAKLLLFKSFHDTFYLHVKY